MEIAENAAIPSGSFCWFIFVNFFVGLVLVGLCTCTQTLTQCCVRAEFDLLPQSH